jgi:hypothetical protein
MQGVKYDAEKLRWDLLPMAPVEQVVGVLTHGAGKYDDWNWLKVVAENPERYYAAAMRHIIAWWLGEKNDPESGFHHLAHTICCLIFLLEGEHANTSNRP